MVSTTGRLIIQAALAAGLVIGGCSGGSSAGPDPVLGPPVGDDNGESMAGLTSEQLEEIESVALSGRPALIACYTEELERRETKQLKGKVTVQIAIGTARATTQVTVTESTLRAPQVLQCIQNEIRKWEWPKLSSPTTHSTTLAFEPAY